MQALDLSRLHAFRLLGTSPDQQKPLVDSRSLSAILGAKICGKPQ